MNVVRGALALAATTLFVGVLATGCGTATSEGEAGSDDDLSSERRPSSSPRPTSTRLPAPWSASPRPLLVQDDQDPVATDLARLVEQFVAYAVGASDTFPHWESVSMSLGGQPVVSIDDIIAALSMRRIWKICPADWNGYGASSCPVDLLSPITTAATNAASLVYSGEYRDVTCAPERTGPLPRGRLVVLRPIASRRTCAGDFALVLAADEQGRLRSIDLTLAEP